MKRKLGAIEVKQAVMADSRFCDLFPELKGEITAIQRNPGCACNRKHLDKFFQYPDRLEQYFPNRIIETVQETSTKLGENKWTVINCHVSELETKLKKLPIGRKQIAVARYEDNVTVVVSELNEVW